MTTEQVRIRTEPGFEMEIEGAVGVSDVRKQQARAAGDAVYIPAGAPASAVVTGTSKYDALPAESDLNMDDLLTYSREIERGIKTLNRR